MQNTPQVSPCEFVESLREETESYLASVMEAVHHAADGEWIVGSEERVRDLIVKRTEGLFDEHRVDPLGNLICRKKPGKTSRSRKQPQSVMLACHIDEIGFYVKFIDKEGRLRLNPVGGLSVHSLPHLDVQGMQPESLIHCQETAYMSYRTILFPRSQADVSKPYSHITVSQPPAPDFPPAAPGGSGPGNPALTGAVPWKFLSHPLPVPPSCRVSHSADSHEAGTGCRSRWPCRGHRRSGGRAYWYRQ